MSLSRDRVLTICIKLFNILLLLFILYHSCIWQIDPNHVRVCDNRWIVDGRIKQKQILMITSEICFKAAHLFFLTIRTLAQSSYFLITSLAWFCWSNSVCMRVRLF